MIAGPGNVYICDECVDICADIIEEEYEEEVETEETEINLLKPVEGCVFRERCGYAREVCDRCRPELLSLPDESRVSCLLYEKEEKESAYE